VGLAHSMGAEVSPDLEAAAHSMVEAWHDLAVVE